MFVEHKLKCTVEFRFHAGDPLFQFRDLLRRKRSARTARDDGVASETVAADESRHVEIFTADTSAERCGLKKRDIPGERAEVARMIGDAFQFQKKRADAQRVTVRRGETLRERAFRQFRERDRGGGGRIARAGFGKRDLTRQISVCGDDRIFNPAMLIPEEYLEIEHILAHALETEMSGLDDARMDGSDGDLMRGCAFQRSRIPGIYVAAERIKLRRGIVRR